MVTNTPLQKSGDSAGEYHLPSGFCLLFIFVVLYCFVTYFVQFGIIVLYVMIDLLDINSLYAW